MPKDDERKEMTQEELDAREEKFRTFFTTSVAQVPEEMTRRDDENEEKSKSLLGRLFRREKAEQQESGTPEESRTGEIQLGGEEPEEPSDLELVLTLEEEVAEPKPEQPKPAEPVSAPQPEPEKPQKPAGPIKAPEPPAPKPEKKPAEKQAASRKKVVQYEPRTPQEQYEDREMQALKAMLFGAKLPPQEEESPQPVKPTKPEKSTPAVPVIAAKPDAEKEPDAAPEKPAVPMPEMVFAEDKASKPHAAPAMQFFGKGDDEKAPAAPARATPPDNDDSMSLPLMFLNDGDEVAPVEPPKEEAPAQPVEEAGTAPAAPEVAPVEEAPVKEKKTPETPEQVGERLHQMGAALTLRCALGGILALVLLHFGLAAEGLVGPLGGLDPVTAPAAFYAADLLFLALALAVGWPVVRDGLKGLRGERPSMETMPAMAACAALLQAAVALLNAQSYQASSFTLLSGIAALGLFLALLGDRVLLASVQGGFKLAQAGPEHRGAFRAKDKDLIRILSKDMDEKDPWVLLSRPAEWDDAMVEQGFGPRACERRARKTNYILLGAAVLAGLVFCVFGGGLNGGAAALTAVLCMGSPLSSTLIAGFASLRLQQTAAASGAVIPGWAAIEELGGVDTVQADADELFTPDSAMLEDIRIFKGGRIDRAILYSASVLSKCCNTLSGLFRQIIEDRTDILYPVKDLEVHRGLGFSAWCDNNRILIGTRAYMEKEEVPLPDEEYEAKHSKNGELQILYLAVSGSLHAMFVLHYVGGRNAARGLEQLQKENIQLLVSCQDPTLTARHITDAYHLPEGMVVLLDQEQCAALGAATAEDTGSEGCCILCTNGFASLTGGLRAAEQAQNAETTATTVQLVSVWFSVAIAVLLTYAGSVGMLSVAAVLMYQAAWSALSIAVCALKQHS